MFSSISPFQLFNREKVEIVDKADFLRASDVLDFFFVSHPASGRKEGTEYRRVLFYYPENEMIDKQVMLVMTATMAKWGFFRPT